MLRSTRGKIVLTTLALQAPLVSILSKTVDQARLIRNERGYFVWTQTGQFSQSVNRFVTYFVIAVSVIELLSRLRRMFTGLDQEQIQSKFPFLLYSFLVIVGLSLLWNMHDWGLQGLFQVFSAICLIASCMSSQLLDFVRLLRTFANVIVISIAVFTLLFPDQSWLPCRLDKCFFSQGLLTGFFPAENYLALFLLAVAPLLSLNRSKIAVRSLHGLLLIELLLTSARAPILIYALFALSMTFTQVKAIMKVVPIAAYLLSCWLFLSMSGREFSGRGSLYAALRLFVEKQLWLGPGPDTRQRIFDSRDISFFAYHEHGMFPYLSVNFGMVAALLVLGLLVQFAKAQQTLRLSKEHSCLVLPPTLLLACGFSETPLQVLYPSPFLWVTLLFLMRLREARRQDIGPGDATQFKTDRAARP